MRPESTDLEALSIILLTGRTTIADVVEGLDAGADDFLPKPYEWAELLARIRVAGEARSRVGPGGRQAIRA